MKHKTLALGLSTALLALASGGALAQDKATEADAKKLLASVQDTAKAKGVKAAVDMLNNGPDCKVKDLGCIIINDGATVLAARNPALVGKPMGDAADMDGKNLAEGVVGPLKAGKTSWDAVFKMPVAGSKAIVPRKYLCAKLDASTATCAVYPL